MRKRKPTAADRDSWNAVYKLEPGTYEMVVRDRRKEVGLSLPVLKEEGMLIIDDTWKVITVVRDRE